MLNIPMLLKHVTLDQARLANDVYKQCIQAGASHEAATGAVWRQAYKNGVDEERIHIRENRERWLAKNQMLTAEAVASTEEVASNE